MANEMFCKSVKNLTDEDRKALGGFIPQRIQSVLLNKNVDDVCKASFFVLWLKGKKPVYWYDENNLEEDPMSIVDWEAEDNG